MNSIHDDNLKRRVEGHTIRLTSAKAFYLLAAIWVFAIAVRGLLFTGYMNGDMGNYIYEAVNLRHGHCCVQDALSAHKLAELVPGPNFNWQNLRIGLIALEGLSMSIFGVSDWSYAVVMFGFFTLGFYLTYAIGTQLQNRVFGVLAAGLFAFIPKEINLTTILIPHLPADAVMALSCYFLIRGFQHWKQAGPGYAPFFLSGVAVGCAYLIHELSILLLPVLALMFWARFPLKEIFGNRRVIISSLLVSAGFAMIFLAEQVYFYITTGVFLLRLKFIAVMGPKWIALNPVDLNTIDYTVYPRAMFFSYDYGIFYYLVALGLVTLAFKYFRSPAQRGGIRKTHLLTIIWFGFIFLYLQFGSTSPTSYKPVFKLPHYLSFIAIPAALLAAVFIYELLAAMAKRLRSRPWGAAPPVLAGLLMLAFFAGSSSLFAWVNYSGNGISRPDLTNEMKIKAVLDRYGAAKIYTDIWTKHGLDFAYGYRKNIVAFNASPPYEKKACPDMSSLKSGFVVVNRIYLNSPYVMGTPIPAIIRKPPPNWQLVEEIPGRSRCIDIYKIVEG